MRESRPGRRPHAPESREEQLAQLERNQKMTKLALLFRKYVLSDILGDLHAEALDGQIGWKQKFDRHVEYIRSLEGKDAFPIMNQREAKAFLTFVMDSRPS